MIFQRGCPKRKSSPQCKRIIDSAKRKAGIFRFLHKESACCFSATIMRLHCAYCEKYSASLHIFHRLMNRNWYKSLQNKAYTNFSLLNPARTIPAGCLCYPNYWEFGSIRIYFQLYSIFSVIILQKGIILSCRQKTCVFHI